MFGLRRKGRFEKGGELIEKKPDHSPNSKPAEKKEGGPEEGKKTRLTLSGKRRSSYCWWRRKAGTRKAQTVLPSSQSGSRLRIGWQGKR